MLELYKEVSLTHDLPESQLKAGDVAVLIDFVPHPEGGEQGCILEVFNAVGETIAVVTVPVSVVQALQSDQVLAVRSRGY
jgi:hypothetical protein